MKIDFDKFDSDRKINDPTNYKWGIFYFNPDDQRIMVPKRSKSMGWTLNFARMYSYIILILIFALAVVLGKSCS